MVKSCSVYGLRSDAVSDVHKARLKRWAATFSRTLNYEQKKRSHFRVPRSELSCSFAAAFLNDLFEHPDREGQYREAWREQERFSSLKTQYTRLISCRIAATNEAERPRTLGRTLDESELFSEGAREADQTAAEQQRGCRQRHRRNPDNHALVGEECHSSRDYRRTLQANVAGKELNFTGRDGKSTERAKHSTV